MKEIYGHLFFHSLILDCYVALHYSLSFAMLGCAIKTDSYLFFMIRSVDKLEPEKA